MRIIDTHLFKSIDKTKINHNQLVKQLAIVRKAGVFIKWDEPLIGAFVWENTPQSHKFWAHIDGW